MKAEVHESFYTHKWVMLHTQRSQVTHTKESWYKYEWVMPRTHTQDLRNEIIEQFLRLRVNAHESCHTQRSHVTQTKDFCYKHKVVVVEIIKESWQKYEWVLSHIHTHTPLEMRSSGSSCGTESWYMSDVTRTEESCHKHTGVMSQI